MIEKEIENLNKNNRSTDNRINLAYESAGSCIEYIDLIQNTIIDTVTLFQKNSIIDANKKFIELTEMLELALTITTKILNTCNSIDDGTINQLIEFYGLCETHLMTILKNIFTAHKQGNISMICDLLEYELQDNLVKWQQESLTPMMKMLKDAQLTV
jgi:hypothetical protein